MDKVYKVVLIGCGHMGMAHLKHIYYKKNIVIEGVVDLDKEKAMECCRMYNAKSHNTNYEVYLKDPEVDIIIIATYPSTHLEILKKCIDAGKHVLCEKPIAQSMEDGEEFFELAKNSKSKVLVGHILRHNDSYKKIADMIHEGAIGKPIIMRMVQNHHTMDWLKYKKLIEETSPIIDCGVHYIDIMRWFTKEDIVQVSGITQRTEFDIPEDKYNYGMITVKLSDGSVGFYEAGWGNTMAASNIKEFVGPKGRITLTYKKDRQYNQEEGDLIEYYRYPEKTYETINMNCDRKPTDLQLEKLIDMIENNAEAVPSMEDVYKAFVVSMKADEAIKKGITVNI